MLDRYEWITSDNLMEDDASDWIMDALNDSEIDPLKEAVKPQIIFSIREAVATSFQERRVFTLGNFSAIIGKAKSKKTYLLTAISACIIAGRMMWDKFVGGLQTGKDLVLYFDTEQGEWDSWNVVRRTAKMAGVSYRDKFKAYNLRQFTPIERCKVIEFALMTYGDEAGFVVIDGIADLANAINDEEEATRVVSLLMRWTKEYNCHIATVIHQNKNDNFATGHLGSSIMKKCEIIVSVTKDQNDVYSSLVECQMSRSVDFNPFRLHINSEGLPEIDNVAIIPDDDKDIFQIEDKVPF